VRWYGRCVRRPIDSRVRVSVCAARDLGDVQAIVEGGADAAGVLVLTRHRAEDAVSLEVARRLLGAVPPPVSRYAVTHAIDYEGLSRIVEELPIDTLQLHDHVAPAVVEKLRSDHPGLRLLKALHVTDEGVGSYREWEGLVDALVVDSVDPAEDRIGGTGRVHDWRVTARVCQESSVPVVLAGGLTPRNVAEAVAVTGAYVANVNSGVEVHGSKDPRLIRAFVRAVHSKVA
jgi:phosphoribosylanthranilate isomerase